MNVTRPVILDMWPVYASGDASPETRALVDEFLAADPEFANQLTRDPLAGLDPPKLPPDVEVRALTRARRRLGGYRSLLTLALVFSGLAFGRIVSDTSWDVSPRNFIATASVAAALWVAFFVSLWRMRARILIVPGPR
jgi:anti-sigma factor RsiW